jgi:hypothetical protein
MSAVNLDTEIKKRSVHLIFRSTFPLPLFEHARPVHVDRPANGPAAGNVCLTAGHGINETDRRPGAAPGRAGRAHGLSGRAGAANRLLVLQETW